MSPLRIDVKWRKIIEVSDGFYDFFKDFQEQQKKELGVKVSFPMASELLLRKIKNNGLSRK